MKIPPVGADLFHAEGRTDGQVEANAFHNFANTHKIREASFHMYIKL